MLGLDAGDLLLDPRSQRSLGTRRPDARQGRVGLDADPPQRRIPGRRTQAGLVARRCGRSPTDGFGADVTPLAGRGFDGDPGTGRLPLAERDRRDIEGVGRGILPQAEARAGPGIRALRGRLGRTVAEDVATRTVPSGPPARRAFLSTQLKEPCPAGHFEPAVVALVADHHPRAGGEPPVENEPTSGETKTSAPLGPTSADGEPARRPSSSTGRRRSSIAGFPHSFGTSPIASSAQAGPGGLIAETVELIAKVKGVVGLRGSARSDGSCDRLDDRPSRPLL